jgi:hypothetical protein
MRNGTAFHIVVILGTLSIAGGGCMSTHVDRLARHDLSPLPSTTTSVVREPGVYTVKWVKGDDASGAIGGTERLLRPGDRVGFTTTGQGELIAIAGEETFPVTSPLPDGTRRVVWYTRREEPSDLTLATGRVLNGAGTAAVVGAAGLGLLVAEGTVQSLAREGQERNETEAEREERRHRRLYRVDRRDDAHRKPLPPMPTAPGAE